MPRQTHKIMDAETASTRDVESYIEGKLSKIRISKSAKSGRMPTGILSLLYPLKQEMNTAKGLIIQIRQTEMKRFLKNEYIKLDGELKSLGLSLQQNDLS